MLEQPWLCSAVEGPENCLGAPTAVQALMAEVLEGVCIGAAAPLLRAGQSTGTNGSAVAMKHK